jgi:hypothetical protein
MFRMNGLVFLSRGQIFLAVSMHAPTRVVSHIFFDQSTVPGRIRYRGDQGEGMRSDGEIRLKSI